MPNIAQGDMFKGSTADVINKEYNYDYPDGLNLKPGSKLHDDLVKFILEKARTSALDMSKRYPSWARIDRTLTSYVKWDDKEKELKDKDDRKPVSIVFPYSFAILETLLSYLVAAFFQDPMFRYDGHGPEDTIGAIMMEKTVEVHCERTKVALALHTLLRDSLAYGFGAGAPGWTTIEGLVSRKRSIMSKFSGMFNKDRVIGAEKITEEAILFEGNELDNIDPYLTLPDPNVSIHNVQKGEFFGWLEKTNYMNLLSDEKNDEDMFNVKYLKHVNGKKTSIFPANESARDDRYGGSIRDQEFTGTNPCDVIHMFVKLIPKEHELGDGEYPEKWRFSIGADAVIVKAMPIGLNHNMFPVVIAAPDFDGYSMTPVSRIETLYGLQETLDWLFNSHIANVRKAVNDMFVYDPYLLNSKDIMNPKAGKMIRTRRPAWGRGVKDSIMQLGVTDVTRGHIADSAFIVQWMNKIGAADDAAMGALRQGGPERLTKGEFQGTQQGMFSRLNRIGRIVGLQAMTDVAYMFASHTQQLMSEELYVKTTGRWQEVLMKEYGSKIRNGRMKVSPFDLLIDYDLKMRDGSVPQGNSSAAFLRMFEIIAKEPSLQKNFDIVRIFTHIARESGAKNVDEFRRMEPNIQVAPDEQVANEAQKGNLVPMQGGGGGL